VCPQTQHTIAIKNKTMNKLEFSQWNKSVPDYDSFQKSVINSITKPQDKKLNCLELGVGIGGTLYFFERKVFRSKLHRS
jgi:hypothetical protein